MLNILLYLTCSDHARLYFLTIYFFYLKRFLYKIIQKLYNIILQYSNFSHFGILGAPRTLHPENLKWETAPQHLFLIFSKYFVLEIVCTLYILLIYPLVQNSANLCFLKYSVLYFWFVADTEHI